MRPLSSMTERTALAWPMGISRTRRSSSFGMGSRRALITAFSSGLHSEYSSCKFLGAESLSSKPRAKSNSLELVIGVAPSLISRCGPVEVGEKILPGTVRTTDFGFIDFVIGKPEFLEFR